MFIPARWRLRKSCDYTTSGLNFSQDKTLTDISTEKPGFIMVREYASNEYKMKK